MFKKIIEFQKLAKAFNGFFLMMQDALLKSENEDVKEDLLVIAYIGRKEIIDRLQKYKWRMTASIFIPMMPEKKKTIALAYQQTIGELMTLSANEGYLEDVQEVLDKGSLYYDLERSIPQHVRDRM